MSSLKVNNFLQPPHTHDYKQLDESPYFTEIEQQHFRDLAKLNEAECFKRVLSHIPATDLTDQEKEVIIDELSNQTSTVMLAFRFYLQSFEHQFFVRRLKNVAMTKMSLLQLRNIENVIQQRQQSEDVRQMPATIDQVQLSFRNNQNDLSRNSQKRLDQDGSVNRIQQIQSSQINQKQHMFTTPQKNSAKHVSVSPIGSIIGGGTSQSVFNPTSHEPKRKVSFVESQMKDVDPKRLNRRPETAKHNASTTRKALVSTTNVLSQKDPRFSLKHNKCTKGNSPKKYSGQPSAVSFSAVLNQIASLGIDVSHMSEYMQTTDNEKNMGPSPIFHEVRQSHGGLTPTLFLQSESSNDQTPKNSNSNTREITTSAQVTQHLTPTRIIKEDQSLFGTIDTLYVMNILRHQANKNHNRIEEEDLVLCLQIVTRQGYTNQQISADVQQLFDDIIISDCGNKRQFKIGEARWLYYEEVLGPITIHSLIKKEQINDSEVLVKRAFDALKHLNGQKLIMNDEIKRFINAVYWFLSHKINKNNLTQIIDKVVQDFIQNKHLILENNNISDLKIWLQSLDASGNRLKTSSSFKLSHQDATAYSPIIQRPFFSKILSNDSVSNGYLRDLQPKNLNSDDFQPRYSNKNLSSQQTDLSHDYVNTSSKSLLSVGQPNDHYSKVLNQMSSSPFKVNNKAQKTYTLGFNGGMIENLNMRSSGIYYQMNKSPDRQMHSDGFSAVRSSYDRQSSMKVSDRVSGSGFFNYYRR